MLGPDDKIWAAINEGGNIRYYTNDPAYASKLPQDIKNWKKDIENWKGELGSWD